MIINYKKKNCDCKNFQSNYNTEKFNPVIGSVLCLEYCIYCKTYDEKYLDCVHMDKLIELRNKKIESL